MMGKFLALTCCIVFLAGCGSDLFKTEAIIESDTSWSGSFDGRTIDGTGHQVIDMGSNITTTKCATVQKQTRQGFLTLRISPGETRTTNAEFGVVTACGGRGY